MNLLNWLQEKLKATYPKDAQDIINFSIEQGKSITFSYENYGDYEVLNFNSLSNVINGEKTPNDREDNRTNPYFVAEEINYFINRYFPNEEISQVLPFARCTWGDKTWFIFFTENNEFPMLVNIDSDELTPKRSKSKISKFIPIEKTLENEFSQENKMRFQNKPNYKEIVSERQTLVTDGEGICGVESYKELIESTLALSMGKFSLTKFKGKETNKVVTLFIEINNAIEGEINLQGETDWIDPSYIQQLNKVLSNHLDGYVFSEFRDWNWGQEFGVVYASLKETQMLDASGYISGK